MSTERLRRWLLFTADVGANVLANLLAAAIVYLGGVLLGLFPREPKAIASAVVIVLSAVMVVIAVLSRFYRDGRRFIATSAFIVLGGISILIAKIAGIDLDSSLEGVAGFVVGAIFVVCGVGLFWDMWSDHRRRTRADRRIRGLSWYEPPEVPSLSESSGGH